MPACPTNRVCRILPALVALVFLPVWSQDESAPAGFTFEDETSLRSVSSAVISPDGKKIAYALRVQRKPGVDDDGPAWAELHVYDVAAGTSRPFVQGHVNVSNLQFTPDGRWIAYAAKRGDDEDRGVWAIPVDGGESRRIATADGGIGDYWIGPGGKTLAYRATEPRSKALEKARKKGYKQEIFEEDWRSRQLFVVPLVLADKPPQRAPGDDEDSDDPEPLGIEGQIRELAWHPSGEKLAISVTDRPLVDDGYMFQRVEIVSVETGEELGAVPTPGKLGKFLFSPDGKTLALISAEDLNDPNEGRLMVAPGGGGEIRDLLPGFNGHVADFAWQDADTLVFVADVGVQTVLGVVDTGGAKPEILIGGSRAGFQKSNGVPKVEPGPILGSITVSADGKTAALTASGPMHPAELFVSDLVGGAPRRLTDSNPWLADVELARQ
ncbi:MAG: hypothetical protein R3344_03790, partial [Acidobacteriota bacterium]|nr:hypothetical protein [Acidobacteriota bacterium]